MPLFPHSGHHAQDVFHLPHKSLYLSSEPLPHALRLCMNSLLQTFSGVMFPHPAQLFAAAMTSTCCSLCLAKSHSSCPDWCGSVGWASSHRPKGQWFDSRSGHMPGLWARSPVGSTQEATTHQCFSPSLSPSLPLFLKINK